MFIVSSKSGGTIETLSHMRYFYERCGGGTAASFVRGHRPGQPAGRGGEERGFRRVFEADPEHRRALLGALALRARAGGARGRRHRGAAQAAPRWPSRTARARRRESNSGLWLGVAVGALALQGRDKADLRRRRADGELRALGRAADRRVDRQGGQGHPAGGGRAGRRPGRVRRRPRVRLPAQRRRARRGARRGGGGARAGRPARAQAARHGGARTSAASSSSPSSPWRWPAGCSASTRSTSRTCRRPRTTPTRCSRPATLPELGAAATLGELLDGAAPAALRGDHGLRRALGRVRRGGHRAARGDPRAGRSAPTTFGYGPRFLHSTGQLHKGGPPTGVFLQLVHDGDEDVEIPEAGYTLRHLKNAQADRRPANAARPRAAGRAGAARGRSRGSARLTERSG